MVRVWKRGAFLSVLGFCSGPSVTGYSFLLLLCPTPQDFSLGLRCTGLCLHHPSLLTSA